MMTDFKNFTWEQMQDWIHQEAMKRYREKNGKTPEAKTEVVSQ